MLAIATILVQRGDIFAISGSHTNSITVSASLVNNVRKKIMENHVNARLARAILPQVASSTPGNIVFLLLSFPLGLIYFLIAVIGLSVGLGTLVIWIGLPILFTTLFIIRSMAEVERRMVSSLLHIPVPYRLSAPPEASS